MKVISILSVLVFIFSCNNSESPSGLEILYFKNPDGDSLRYTRYYTYLQTDGTTVSNKLQRNLTQPFEKLAAIKPFRSEGKIYIPKGQEAAQTVFFSTRCDSCGYLYFIKNGEFIYFKLAPSLREELIKRKASSVEPKAEAGQ